MPTRRAMTVFSLQVLTNSRYFWRLSKKRKLRDGAAAPVRRSTIGAAAPPTRMSWRSSGGAVGRGDAVATHEGADALQRLGRDAGAVAQARDELAVVHRAAAEGRLRDAVALAELRDAVEQRAGRLREHVHALPPSPEGTLAERMLGPQPRLGTA